MAQQRVSDGFRVVKSLFKGAKNKVIKPKPVPEDK